MQELINRAKELLADGTVARVLGWKAGDLPYNPEAAYFETAESLDEFVYNGFCGQNLSKMMIEASKLEGKTLVCLKPCDTYSFNQLIKEHRVDREKAYIIGVGCKGKLDVEKLRKMGIKGIQSISGAELTDDCEILNVSTIYGDKTVAYKDAMLLVTISSIVWSMRLISSIVVKRTITVISWLVTLGLSVEPAIHLLLFRVSPSLSRKMTTSNW